jgi:hypothetical protein
MGSDGQYAMTYQKAANLFLPEPLGRKTGYLEK